MPNFDIEDQFKDKIVCGIDEAGLGPLAGPIVVCSCVIKNHNLQKELLENIDDSKKLLKKKRERIYNLIIACSEIKYAISIVDPMVIDSFGLSKAWQKGVIESIKNNAACPQICLIDGIKNVDLDGIETIPIVKGDQKSYSIAAASIIAKVARDKIMEEIHKEFPEYGFFKNVGYGTKAHLEALKKIGPCKHHRKSYAPVAACIKNLT